MAAPRSEFFWFRFTSGFTFTDNWDVIRSQHGAEGVGALISILDNLLNRQGQHRLSIDRLLKVASKYGTNRSTLQSVIQTAVEEDILVDHEGFIQSPMINEAVASLEGSREDARNRQSNSREKRKEEKRKEEKRRTHSDNKACHSDNPPSGSEKPLSPPDGGKAASTADSFNPTVKLLPQTQAVIEHFKDLYRYGYNPMDLQEVLLRAIRKHGFKRIREGLMYYTEHLSDPTYCKSPITLIKEEWFLTLGVEQ